MPGAQDMPEPEAPGAASMTSPRLFARTLPKVLAVSLLGLGLAALAQTKGLLPAQTEFKSPTRLSISKEAPNYSAK